ncbi:MAG: peptidylprolyl isomerase [Acidobacteriota bacterium]
MAALFVNDEAIEDAAIQREAAAILKLMAERMRGEDPATLRARAREWAEENLIEAALLRQAAMNDPEPLETPPDCSPEAETQLRLERLIARVTSQASPPRHKDIVAFYLKHRNAFEEPEKIRAAHIVRNVDESNTEESAFAAISRARDELAKGRPFGEVADELSDCPGQGGDLGFFTRGHMVSAFEEIAFRLATNEVSGIFRSEFGYHIATVLERKPVGIAKLEEVRERIEENLLAEKKQKRLHQYVDHLRARAAIRKNS